MGVFNNFPYANFHELNADWIIEQVRKVMDDWEEYKTDMDLWKLGVDDQLAEFQAWFDNLDVQDEVRTVINELIHSGEFIEIAGPQIVSATEAWLAAHITPTTPAVDDTLSISGAAADAKVTGDRISDLKEDLFLYNALDLFMGELTKTTGTSNGVTFTWSGDVCTVTGTSTGYSINLLASAALPAKVIAGNTYYFKYKTTDPNLRLRFIWRTADADIRSDYITQDTAITIPSNAVRWHVSLFVSSTTPIASPSTVSQIGMLDTKSNKELVEALQSISDEYMTGRATLASNTDLDTVKTEGHWVLSSGYSYDNSPLPTGYAGTLIVFKNTANTVTQIMVEITTNPKVYVRSSILGTFKPWSLIADVYNNSYNTDYYENTYNITTSPTITTDTNNYLPSTGDQTDRSADIQAMLNSTGTCHLGPGLFMVSGVDIADYKSVIGSGKYTTVRLLPSVENGYAFKLGTQSSLSDLRISGGTSAPTLSSTVGTRHGVLFQGTKVSGQSGGTTKKRATIDRLIISNFTGGGITCTGTGVDLDSNMLISDCFVDHCGAGLYIPYYSEFHRIVNCAFTYNWYGVVDNGGNNNFANCDFSGNKIGVLIDNSTDQSPNNSHGSFTNCSINHSYSDAGVINGGTAIKLLKSNLGEIFTGMQIFYGAIVLDDCVGTRFIGANIGSKVPITITDSTVVTFSDCTFKEGPNHTDSPFTQSNNTVLKFTDCYLRDGTVYNPMS